LIHSPCCDGVVEPGTATGGVGAGGAEGSGDDMERGGFEGGADEGELGGREMLGMPCAGVKTESPYDTSAVTPNAGDGD